MAKAWRVAKGLLKLREQINTQYPGRKKDSDGTIGNVEHSARESDHNPDGNGVVHALDTTHDPAHGFDSYAFSDMLIRQRDPRIKYCLTPDTKVLKADLTWGAIIDIPVGEELLAFDERGEDKPWHSKGVYKVKRENLAHMAGQKFRTAIVEETEIIQQPCYELQTTKGRVVASDNHMWLAGNAHHGKYRSWIETKDIKPGVPLQYFCSPWEPETSYEAGWLAGLFDGEGCLSRPKGGGWILSVNQKEGHVLSLAIELLESFGVNYETYDNGPCQALVIRGGLTEVLRFLGRFPSARLTRKAVNERIWESHSIPGMDNIAYVESIIKVGSREVVSMQTSTRTLIAAGIFSHNCISNRRIASGPAGPQPWVWRKYTGKNPHDHHNHVSIHYDAKYADDESPWMLDGAPSKGSPSVAHAAENYTPPPKTLKLRSTGADVRTLQQLLGFLGKDVDGRFGLKTRGAVIKLQEKAKLHADGIVGPQTWTELRRLA